MASWAGELCALGLLRADASSLLKRSLRATVALLFLEFLYASDDLHLLPHPDLHVDEPHDGAEYLGPVTAPTFVIRCPRSTSSASLMRRRFIAATLLVRPTTPGARADQPTVSGGAPRRERGRGCSTTRSLR